MDLVGRASPTIYGSRAEVGSSTNIISGCMAKFWKLIDHLAPLAGTEPHRLLQVAEALLAEAEVAFPSD
jgi:hypothetical protein